MSIYFDNKKPNKILCMGRATIDIYPNTFGPLSDVTSFTKYMGGSPANTAVAIANAGVDTAFLGKVSSDSLGDFVVNYLKSKGIETTHMKRASRNVLIGCSLAEMLTPEECSCHHYRQDVADLHLRCDEISEEYIAGFKALQVSGASLSTSPAREAMILAVTYAKRNGVTVIFDPDYRANAWVSQDEVCAYYNIIAEKADIIISNDDEFEMMNRLVKRKSSQRCDWISERLSNSVKLICVKHGGEGAEVYTNDGVWQGAVFPNQVKNSFGAGDAFGGTFVALLMQTGNLEYALRYGSAAASITVSGIACAESMPSWEELCEFVKLRPNEGKVTRKK